jgi:hypothetical protein
VDSATSDWVLWWGDSVSHSMSILQADAVSFQNRISFDTVIPMVARLARWSVSPLSFFPVLFGQPTLFLLSEPDAFRHGGAYGASRCVHRFLLLVLQLILSFQRRALRCGDTYGETGSLVG